MADAKTPAAGKIRSKPYALNVAVEVNDCDHEEDPREAQFTHTTDDGLASRRDFMHRVRSHEELEAGHDRNLPAGFGLSMRQRMAGAAWNDQFPWRTDIYGKQRT